MLLLPVRLVCKDAMNKAVRVLDYAGINFNTRDVVGLAMGSVGLCKVVQCHAV